MKITMYDLFGLVKDEKAPKKIKWGDTKYTLYIDEDTKQKYYQDDKCRYFFLSIKCLNDLNDTVEIIEETKTPEKLGDCAYVDGEIAYSWSRSEEKLKTKINEIIDYLKSKGE